MDIISMRDFSKEDILTVLDLTAEVKRAIHDPQYDEKVFRNKHARRIPQLLEELTVATLFLENSTRTNHSFRAAVMKSGGRVDGFSSPDDTSLKKGETWADTVAMFAGYGFDAIVMRSTTEGLPRWTQEFLEANHQQMAAQHKSLDLPYSYRVPVVINGGDGKNQHPTQCFLDLFTMRELARAKGRDLEGLEVALLNDLAHGRTNASLMSVAHHFDWKLHFAYPHRFGPQAHLLEALQRKGVGITDHQEDFLSAMREVFVAYHSRPQKERVGAGEDLIMIKELGQINLALYEQLGAKAPYLMHPLPVDAETFEEIRYDLRDHPLNVTKLQSSNGLYVRIALLALILERMTGDRPLSSLERKIQEVELQELPLSGREKDLLDSRSGFIKGDGVVLDHISPGMARRLAGILGLEGEEVAKVISDYIPVRDHLKDMIKIHRAYELTSEQYEALALVSPEVTVSYVEGGKVVRKVRPIIGNLVEGRVRCGNSDCVTNVRKEHVVQKHRVGRVDGEIVLECGYCERPDTVQRIYQEERFIYIGK